MVCALFSLVGESFDNRDGTSRQTELLVTAPGERAYLRREPDNPHDSNAVLVLSARGVGIGHLSRADAAALAAIIDAGLEFDVQVHCLRGGLPDYPSYGCTVSVAVRAGEHGECEPLDDAQIEERCRRIEAL